ncbi:signal peptide peptidase SppA, 36K type [Isosphaera pallida ATCC 43644]|uniref:Signal peptide peptidase SppA, 36K type n=1 Tax=Isosphaera pallida (strain ATCC 43644 / DSM 9630 / IS1B) TaxID=575540 RepID=E8QWC7_ISOPI|nr:signal peptide peptidase SppA [Isosphaera pallida]ADV60814.1 signal peptide peptidase SppA, 36K type [Isosphaera pallida ATCC 43644]
MSSPSPSAPDSNPSPESGQGGPLPPLPFRFSNLGGGSTIILERGRRGWPWRWAVWGLLLVSLLLNVSLLTASLGPIPDAVREQYVAGPIGPGKAKLAIIEITGSIDDSKADGISRQITQASLDSSVKGVLLRIDSPGGTVSASDRLWRDVQTRLVGRKPVVVSMGSRAASGGYYIACAGDALFAEPATITGSIGVILEIPQISGLLDKIGVEFATLTTGKFKDSGSIYRPITNEERQRFLKSIDQSYQRFLRVVAQGRKMELSQLKPLADGSIFSGEEALENGLVDFLGYQDDALRHLLKLTRLEEAQVVRYVPPNSLATLLELLELGSRLPSPHPDPDESLSLWAPASQRDQGRSMPIPLSRAQVDDWLAPRLLMLSR